MRTDEGHDVATFGYTPQGTKGAAYIAAELLKPFFLGRNPLYREKHWHEFRMTDRWMNLTPIYSYGPFDIACWLVCAQAAGQPL